MTKDKRIQWVHEVLVGYLKLLGYALLMVIALLAVLYVLVLKDKQYNKENAEDLSKVTVGMSLEQVKEVMRNEPQVSGRSGEYTLIYNTTDGSARATIKFNEKREVVEVGMSP